MSTNGLPDLSRMKDEDYKKLTGRELALYNTELPVMSYDKPYSHQPYPAVRYRVIVENGEKMLEDIECPDAKTDAALKKEGWKESPTACGVETHPSAPALARRRSKVPVAPKEPEVVTK